MARESLKKIRDQGSFRDLPAGSAAAAEAAAAEKAIRAAAERALEKLRGGEPPK